jgi:hypothetical protein
MLTNYSNALTISCSPISLTDNKHFNWLIKTPYYFSKLAWNATLINCAIKAKIFLEHGGAGPPDDGDQQVQQQSKDVPQVHGRALEDGWTTGQQCQILALVRRAILWPVSELSDCIFTFVHTCIEYGEIYLLVDTNYTLVVHSSVDSRSFAS